MKRILNLTLFFLFTTLVHGQDLIQKVPADAKVVATIKGNKFFELLSVDEFNSSYAGKRLLSKISREKKATYQSIQDFGIDMNASFYYYLQSNDSMHYNCFLVPISNAEKFDKIVSDSGEKKFTISGGIRTLIDHDSSIIWQWNDKQLLIVKGIENGTFFSRRDVKERYDLKYAYEDVALSTDSLQDVIDSVKAAIDGPSLETQDAMNEEKVGDPSDAAPVIADAAPPKKAPVKKKTGTTKKTTTVNKKGGKTTKKTSTKPVKKPTTVIQDVTIEETEIDSTDSPLVDTAFDYHGGSGYPYVSVYDIKQKRKDSLIANWTLAQASAIFAKPMNASITTNPSYTKSIEPNEQASVWIANGSDLYSSLMGGNKYLMNMNVLQGWGSMTANLVMDNKQIKMSGKLELTGESAESYKKIYSSKLNKNILKYVNEDRMIGYMTCAINTKSYLEEYPKMLTKLYGSSYGDEASLGADLISLLLDEEAVSKVFKGDGILIFSGVSQREVSYKTYEYDDNYKSIEIEKKKTETLPDFLFMTSTEDPAFLQKIINYGIKKKAVVAENGYYKIEVPNDPMQLFVMIKDGILFLGNNKPEIEKIVAGKYDAKVSKETKKLMMSSYFSTYFSPKKLAGKIPADEYGDMKSIMRINKTLNGTGDLYFKCNEIRDNIFSADLTVEVPAGQENSLKYLFFLVQQALKD